MIIAFMGNDGSGKTTISTHIYKLFLSKGLQVYYKPEFEYFLIGYLLNPFGKQREQLAASLISRKNIQSRNPIFKVWPYIIWVDFLFFWLFLKAFKRKQIVLLDRYLYDFLMSWEYLGYSNHLLRSSYLAFPLPDIPIVCKVSPQIAYARKATYNIEFFRVQTRRYETLARYLGVAMIDTSKPLKATLDQLTEGVLASVLQK